MGDDPLEETPAHRLQAAKAHLPSHAAGRCQNGPQTPTPVAKIPVGTIPGCPASDPRESRQENGWGRWSESFDGAPTTQAGEYLDAWGQGPTGPPGLDSQARHDRTPAAWHSRDG